MTTLTPFRLRPWFRTRIWGRRNLAPWYDHTAFEQPVGEVWLNGEDCIVDSGPLAGQTFSVVFKSHRELLLGANSNHRERFPLLMKVIFPQENLSVQVHPDDAMAREHGEPHGKTECWYALEAEPGAAVGLGLHSGATQTEVRAAIESDTLETLLQWIPVQKGDMIFVDAGTVHAIGPGVVLLETQQNSDMTYRLYDYGRPRELHLEKGLQAVRLQTDAGKVKPQVEDKRTLLMQSNYFQVDHYRLTTPHSAENFPFHAQECSDSRAVQLIFVAGGCGTLDSKGKASIQLHRGELAVVPACAAEWTLTPAESMEILRVIPQ